jgi:hypothetical protein
MSLRPLLSAPIHLRRVTPNSLRPYHVLSRSTRPDLGSSLISFSTSRYLSTTPPRPLNPPNELTKTSTTIARAATSPIPPWAEKLPKSLKWLHPYLSLARLDKPIGTWLLFWPCGKSLSVSRLTVELTD